MVGIYVRCQTHDTCMSILLDNRYNKHCLRLSLTDCDARDPTNLQVHEYGSLSIPLVRCSSNMMGSVWEFTFTGNPF